MKFFDVLFALFFGVCRWNAVPTGLPFRFQVRGNPRYGGVLSNDCELGRQRTVAYL